MQKLKIRLYNFLRWSEKYTKTDMVYLFENGSWMTAGKIFSSIASFLSVLAFANLLTPEAYGSYKYILSLIALLSIPSLSGMNTSLTRSVAQGYEGSVKKIFYAKARWGALGSLASLITASYYYINGDINLTIAFCLTAIFLPYMNASAIYSSYLSGKKYFKKSVLYGGIKQIISLSIMVTVLYLTNNILLVIFTYLASGTFLNLFFLRYILKTHNLNSQTDLKTISYGKHLSLMGVIGAIAGQLDKILIWHYLGGAPLAVYSFALAPVLRLKGFLKPISSLAFPKIAQKNYSSEKNKKELLHKIFRFSLILIIPVSIYILLAPAFYKIFFPQYIDAIIYSQVYALSLVFYPFILTSTYLTAQAKQKPLYILSILNPTFKIIMMLILLPMYGIPGAITALLFSHLFNIITNIIFFSKN